MAKKYALLVFFIALAMILSACQPAAPAATKAPATEAPATEAVKEECKVKVGVPTLLTGVGAPMGT